MYRRYDMEDGRDLNINFADKTGPERALLPLIQTFFYAQNGV